MLLYRLDKQTVLTFPAYRKEAQRLLLPLGYTVKTVANDPQKQYPHDIALNCLRLGDTVYGHSRAASEIQGSCGRFQVLRQGYTRCSCAVVTDRAVITSDEGLQRVLQNDGVRVLKIVPGHILLSGYPYGFIGGCTVDLDEAGLGFFGNLKNHPDGEAITEFCRQNGRNAVSLSRGMLHDVGGGMVFPSDRR